MSWTRPPRGLRKVRLDNILLIPASALPDKARYQALANDLPRGDVLIVLPAANYPARQLLQTAARLFEAKGRHVTTVQPNRRPHRC